MPETDKMKPIPLKRPETDSLSTTPMRDELALSDHCSDTSDAGSTPTGSFFFHFSSCSMYQFQLIVQHWI